MTDQPLQEESLRSQAVSGFLWLAVQTWTVRLSTFIAFLLLGRLLTPEDFGVVALGMAFIVLLTVVADAGFATYLVQARELTSTAKNTAFYIATASGVTLAVLLSAIAYPLSRVLDVPDLALVLPVLASSLVFVGLSSVPAALLQRELKFQQLARRQMLATGLSVVAAVALAFAGAGVWALVAQTLVRQVIASIVLMAVTDFRPRRGFSRPEARVMLAYSTKAMGAQILAQGRDQGEVLIIGAIAGPVALGLWTVASRLVTVLSDLLGTVFATVARPLFARVQTDSARLGRAVSAAAGLGTLVLVPALTSLALLSGEVIPDVFGRHWRGATGIAAILALRGVFTALTLLDRSALLNAGRAGGELRVIAASTAIHCVIVAAFAGAGVETLAVVVLVESVLLAPIRPYLLRHWLGVPYRSYLGAVQVIVSAALAGGASLLLLHWQDLTGRYAYAAVFFAGGALYLLLVILLARPVVGELLSALSHVKHSQRTQAMLSFGSAERMSMPRKTAAALWQLGSRRDATTVVFNSFGGQFSDNPRGIYDELVARNLGLRHAWVARPEVELPAGVERAGPITADYFDTVGRARVVVSNARMTHYVKKPGVIYLQTWHGTPLKKIGYDNPRYSSRTEIRSAAIDYRRWDLLISQNAFSTEIFRRAFRYDGEILEVGYPRNDVLQSAQAADIRRRTRARYGVADDVVLVLYAPTFRDDLEDASPRRTSLPLDLDRMEEALGRQVHVITRLHLRDSALLGEPRTGFWSSGNAHPDIRELYLAADVLLTDYSSSMFDFAVTGKPMVFFTYDLEHYRDNLRGFYFDFEAQAPGPLCSTTDEVIEQLSHLDLVRRDAAPSYQRFRQTYCYLDDGRASARVVDRLLRDLGVRS